MPGGDVDCESEDEDDDDDSRRQSGSSLPTTVPGIAMREEHLSQITCILLTVSLKCGEGTKERSEVCVISIPVFHPKTVAGKTWMRLQPCAQVSPWERSVGVPVCYVHAASGAQYVLWRACWLASSGHSYTEKGEGKRHFERCTAGSRGVPVDRDHGSRTRTLMPLSLASTCAAAAACISSPSAAFLFLSSSPSPSRPASASGGCCSSSAVIKLTVSSHKQLYTFLDLLWSLATSALTVRSLRGYVAS